MLHTWSQNCYIIPTFTVSFRPVDLSPDGSRWIRCRPKFFLPVKVLSRLFRGKFLALLRELLPMGNSNSAGVEAVLEPARFHAWLRELKDTSGSLRQTAVWRTRICIEVRGPLHTPGGDHQRAPAPLGQRSSHFSVAGLQRHNQIRAMTLDAVEFIRRFLLHILPSGFIKIRHFGFLSNRRRAAALASCRAILPQPCGPHGPHSVGAAASRRGAPMPVYVRQGRCTLAVGFQPPNFWPISIISSQRISSILHDHAPEDQKSRPALSAAT